MRLVMFHTVCPKITAKIRVSVDSPQHTVPAQSLQTEPGPNGTPCWEELGSQAVRRAGAWPPTVTCSKAGILSRWALE